MSSVISYGRTEHYPLAPPRPLRLVPTPKLIGRQLNLGPQQLPLYWSVIYVRRHYHTARTGMQVSPSETRYRWKRMQAETRHHS